MARKYELRERADGKAATRERIVEATVALHEKVGPGRTTISAIAELAGVQRLTVYRHFPDERSLFQACSARWTAQNPKPDPAVWARIDDPEKRLHAALCDLYAYFDKTEGMTGNLLRDLPDSPALQQVAEPFSQYWRTVRDVLDCGWNARGRMQNVLRAAIGHAVAFETWRSLTRREGLVDRDAVDVMMRLVRAIQV